MSEILSVATKEFAAKGLAGARIDVAGGLHRPPLEPSATADLYAIAEKVAKDIGMPPLGSAEVGGASVKLTFI
ncbi:MAG: hypothetical protein RIR68_3154 [Pseudomonadota bacterium]